MGEPGDSCRCRGRCVQLRLKGSGLPQNQHGRHGFAFLEEFRHRLRDEALEAGCIPVGFLQAARHVPVNYVLVPAGSAREEHIYVLSLQIMEDFRIAEETHAPRAWQLCQLWAQARGMKQKAGSATEDAAGAVAEMLKRVRCGKTCEYAEKGTIVKRVVQDALNVYDRVMAAGIGDALEQAGAEFGPRSPLTSMSKLVKLSQAVQAAAASRKANPAVLLRRAVQVMLLRLQLSLTDPLEGIAALGKTEVPRCILIGELLAEAAACLPGDGQPETVQEVLLAMSTSVPKPSAVEAAAKEASQPSVQAGLHWARRVLMGQLDAVLREVVHQDFKKAPPKQVLLHGKLGWCTDVQPKLDSEGEQRKRKAVAAAASSWGIAPDEEEMFATDLVQVVAAASAASASLPASRAEPGEGALVQVASPEPPAAVSPADARAAHAKKALAEVLRLDVCPAVDAGVGDWAAILDRLCAGSRDAASRDGFQLHAWVLDAASDAEPVLQDGESVFARPPAVNKVLAERFFKAAGRIAGAEKNFVLLAPARGEGAKAMLKKIMGEDPFEETVADHLNIVYKELSKGRGQRKVRTKLVELVLGFASKAAVAASASAPPKKCNRLHFTATSTWSDTIVNATPPGWEHQPRIPLERKAKVLGPGGLLRGEDLERSAAEEFVLLHHEKAPELWAEVFHHYRVSSVATATPGSGAMLKAAIGMQIQVAALCKNAEHKAFLEEHLLEWAVGESQRASSWCFASDADLGCNPAGELDESGGEAEEEESEASGRDDSSQEPSAAESGESLADSRAAAESGEALASSRAAAAAAADAAAKLAAKAAAAGMKRMAKEARAVKRASGDGQKKLQAATEEAPEDLQEKCEAPALKKSKSVSAKAVSMGAKKSRGADSVSEAEPDKPMLAKRNARRAAGAVAKARNRKAQRAAGTVPLAGSSADFEQGSLAELPRAAMKAPAMKEGSVAARAAKRGPRSDVPEALKALANFRSGSGGFLPRL